MILEIIILATKRTDFFQDMILPAAVGGIVILLLLNSVLKKWGYSLF